MLNLGDRMVDMRNLRLRNLSGTYAFRFLYTTLPPSPNPGDSSFLFGIQLITLISVSCLDRYPQSRKSQWHASAMIVDTPEGDRVSFTYN